MIGHSDGMDDYGFAVFCVICFILFLIGLAGIAIHAAFF